MHPGLVPSRFLCVIVGDFSDLVQYYSCRKEAVLEFKFKIRTIDCRNHCLDAPILDIRDKLFFQT